MTGRWLFDLGNTRLKFAPLLAGGVPGETMAIAHDQDGLAAGSGLLPQGGATAYLASVASATVTAALQQMLATRFRRVVSVRTQPEFAGVRIAYADPTRLGVDRFLALLAAHARGDGPWLLVGVGTALTIDLLDRDGRHHGGRIAPSPALMRTALHQRARQLPEVGGRYAEFADDTQSALASGCEGAALALVERSQVEAARLLGSAAGLLLHGGGASELAARLPQAELVAHLVLQGLACWAHAACDE
ncbi:type III pantothenate kinase [Luteimonas cucumeris]|uniref:Type III pantothenate kinase n=1 Tax=Luteimonas cucumeris TaxID=985012 RepID=A0A562L5Y9_9GAMM|nr:type III pantothenate kinase [Luteimonas cucumeris]TWI03048.1 type III pantothenate kinase [Luteimonas cucumeris]